MLTEDAKEMIKPLSFSTLEELARVRNQLSEPPPAWLEQGFLVDSRGETYFLLDIVSFSNTSPEKEKLFFEKKQALSTATLPSKMTALEVSTAYYQYDDKALNKLLGQLRLNRVVAQALKVLGKYFIKADLAKMEEILTCSISRSPYISPLLAPSGHTFECDYIIFYLAYQSSRDPFTRDFCSTEQLIPNKPVDQLMQLLYEYAPADKQQERIENLQEERMKIINMNIPSLFSNLSRETLKQEKENLKKLIMIRKQLLNTIHYLPGNNPFQQTRTICLGLILPAIGLLGMSLYFFISHTTDPVSWIVCYIICIMPPLLLLGSMVIYERLTHQLPSLNGEIHFLRNKIRKGQYYLHRPKDDEKKLLVEQLDQQINKLENSVKKTTFFHSSSINEKKPRARSDSPSISKY